MTSNDVLYAAALFSILGMFAIQGWAIRVAHRKLASIKDYGEQVSKIQSDLATAQGLADATSQSAAKMRAALLGASQAARQLSTELERGLRA